MHLKIVYKKNNESFEQYRLKFCHFEHIDMLQKHKLRKLNLEIATRNHFKEMYAVSSLFHIFLNMRPLRHLMRIYFKQKIIGLLFLSFLLLSIYNRGKCCNQKFF